jgi:hypothetical protein
MLRKSHAVSINVEVRTSGLDENDRHPLVLEHTKDKTHSLAVSTSEIAHWAPRQSLDICERGTHLHAGVCRGRKSKAHKVCDFIAQS